MEIECGTESQWWQWNGQSHIHVWWIKIRRDTLGASNPSPRPDHTAQGSSARKITTHNFWLQKPVGVGDGRRNSQIFRRLHLKGPHGLRTYTNPPTLGFTTRATAGMVPVIYGEWLR